MDYIGISDLSMIMLRNAENHSLEPETMRIQSLEIFENADSYESLALYYEKQLNKDFINWEIFDKIIYNYEKAIELEPENIRIIYNFAEFWKGVGNHCLMIKYLKMGADAMDMECIVLLASHYYNENTAIFVHYYLMTNYDVSKDISSYPTASRELYHEYIEEKVFEVYDLLQKKDDNLVLPLSFLLKLSIDDTKLYMDDHIRQMRSNPTISSYINKVNLFTRLNNICECVICYDTKLNICFDCGHEICVDCFKRSNVCHYCRF